MLAELGGEAVAGQREALVAALCRLLAREGGDGKWAEEDAGTRDNAAGAAARVLFAANGAGYALIQTSGRSSSGQLSRPSTRSQGFRRALRRR